MKHLFILLTLLLAVTLISAQFSDCKHGQCSQIKTDGTKCKRCVGDLESYCSSHKSTTFSAPIFEAPPSTTTSIYCNSNNHPSDCKFSQCDAFKQDGSRNKKCTGGIYEKYSNVLKFKKKTNYIKM